MKDIKIGEATTIVLSEKALKKAIEEGINKIFSDVYNNIGIETGDIDFDCNEDLEEAVNILDNVLRQCIYYNFSTEDNSVDVIFK